MFQYLYDHDGSLRFKGQFIKAERRHDQLLVWVFRDGEITLDTLSTYAGACANSWGKLYNNYVSLQKKWEQRVRGRDYSELVHELESIKQRLHFLDKMRKYFSTIITCFDAGLSIHKYWEGIYISEDQKEEFFGSLKDAAYKIRSIYNKNKVAKIPRYRSMKCASDTFFDKHFFINYPKITKKKLYENVKKWR